MTSDGLTIVFASRDTREVMVHMICGHVADHRSMTDGRIPWGQKSRTNILTDKLG